MSPINLLPLVVSLLTTPPTHPALTAHIPPLQEEVEGDVSRSSVTLVPEARDHGSLVTCHAQSRSLPDQVLSSATTLSVLCELPLFCYQG